MEIIYGIFEIILDTILIFVILKLIDFIKFIVEKIKNIFKDDQLPKGNEYKASIKKDKKEIVNEKSTIQQNKYFYPNSIKDIIDNRNIKYLIHFTNIKNIETILKYGICSRNILDKNSINYEYNDNQRIDDKLNCSCFSVEFPNNRFFYKLRQNTNQQYCIIVLDAKEILLNTDNKKYFFRKNAASADSLKNGDRTTVESFEEMFDDYGDTAKYRNNLPDNMPTNLQSEILISGRISSKYIVSIEFENEISYNNCLNFFNAPQYIVNAFKNIFIINEYFFLRRSDACTIENNKTPSIKDYSDIHRKIKKIIEDNKPSSDNKNNSNESEDYLSKVKKGFPLDKVPYEFLNEEIVYEALKRNSLNLKFIPKEYLTKELFLNLYNEGEIELRNVPKEYYSFELCKSALKEGTYNIEYFPSEYLTDEIYEYALNNDIYAIMYVPEKLLTPEICSNAIKENCSLLEYIPHKFLTNKMCIAAIKRDYLLLKSIPPECLTKDLLKEIKSLLEKNVANNPDIILSVPKKFLSAKLYKIAVNNNTKYIKYVPKKVLTQKFFEEGIVTYDSNIIKAIPPQLFSERISVKAVKYNVYNIKFIPKEFLTDEVCLFAIKNDYKLLKYVPAKSLKLDTLEEIKQFLKTLMIDNPDIITVIPQHFLSKEICEIAIKKSIYYKKYIPEKLLTDEEIKTLCPKYDISRYRTNNLRPGPGGWGDWRDK